MCGIVGQANLRETIRQERFLAMRDSLAHRGPDGYGAWFSPGGRTALGHRRLAFLDLSDAGSQPMSNETGTAWLTCNGEIYNYLEIKEQLLGLGHRFHSESDSEVILHGYEEWGAGLLPKLKGMFAFGIWDARNDTLLLARDRFGIKPLYYGWEGENFFFASELKAILAGLKSRPEPDPTAICDYLAYRYIPSPKSIWKGFHKLPPAHYLQLSFKDGKHMAHPLPYWELELGYRRERPEAAVERVGHHLEKSVAQHLQSDVPIGNFLSGGYDSSALVAYSTQLGFRPNTFAIGFEQWENSEHQYAEIVARHLGVPLATTIVGKEQLGLLGQLVYHYDEPIADISIIPTYMVSQLAAESNKAVLSGEGADELFGGYTWQKEIARMGTIQRYLQYWSSAMVGHSDKKLVENYAQAMAMGRFHSQNLKEFLHPRLLDAIPAYSEWFYASHYQPGLWPLKAFQYLDVKAFMGELVLTKIDRASMAHGLEVRVPFLDHELVEYMFSLHPEVYFRKGQTKFLLRENIKTRLPEVILQRPKQGFVGPDTYYMDIEWYARNLQNGVLLRDEAIHQAGLNKLIANKDHWRLWKLAVLEKWWQQWMA